MARAVAIIPSLDSTNESKEFFLKTKQMNQPNNASTQGYNLNLRLSDQNTSPKLILPQNKKNFFKSILKKSVENVYPHKNMHTNVYSSFTHNCQN